jgi:hypothetical protein
MEQPLSDFNKKLKQAMGMPEEKAPYISMNKLAEYMTASAIRRRQIVKNLKKDSDFFKVYYSEVKNVMNKYFKSGYDSDLIEELIKKIESKTTTSDWDKSDNSNSIIALENMLESNLPDLSNYEFVKDTFKIKSVYLSKVEVTIKPSIYLINKSNDKVGAIKTHIAKTPDNQLEDENRSYAATLIKYALIDSGLDEKKIDDSACISYDIFKKDYSTSSKSYKRTLASLEAACEEIALRWAIS